eukprot:1151759-Pelagomonas_calceolata.AAC.2
MGPTAVVGMMPVTSIATFSTTIIVLPQLSLTASSKASLLRKLTVKELCQAWSRCADLAKAYSHAEEPTTSMSDVHCVAA